MNPLMKGAIPPKIIRRVRYRSMAPTKVVGLSQNYAKARRETRRAVAVEESVGLSAALVRKEEKRG